VNDWVEAGQQIGSLQTAVDGEQSFLHFAVKQNDRYMDPLDVIPID
jgi:stage IV sporulation protein FA